MSKVFELNKTECFSTEGSTSWSLNNVNGECESPALDLGTNFLQVNLQFGGRSFMEINRGTYRPHIQYYEVRESRNQRKQCVLPSSENQLSSTLKQPNVFAHWEQKRHKWNLWSNRGIIGQMQFIELYTFRKHQYQALACRMKEHVPQSIRQRQRLNGTTYWEQDLGPWALMNPELGSSWIYKKQQIWWIRLFITGNVMEHARLECIAT